MFIQLDYPKKEYVYLFPTYIFFFKKSYFCNTAEHRIFSYRVKGHSSVFVKKQTFYCATEIVGQKRIDISLTISVELSWKNIYFFGIFCCFSIVSFFSSPHSSHYSGSIKI